MEDKRTQPLRELRVLRRPTLDLLAQGGIDPLRILLNLLNSIHRLSTTEVRTSRAIQIRVAVAGEVPREVKQHTIRGVQTTVRGSKTSSPLLTHGLQVREQQMPGARQIRPGGAILLTITTTTAGVLGEKVQTQAQAHGEVEEVAEAGDRRLPMLALKQITITFQQQQLSVFLTARLLMRNPKSANIALVLAPALTLHGFLRTPTHSLLVLIFNRTTTELFNRLHTALQVSAVLLLPLEAPVLFGLDIRQKVTTMS